MAPGLTIGLVRPRGEASTAWSALNGKPGGVGRRPAPGPAGADVVADERQHERLGHAHDRELGRRVSGRESSDVPTTTTPKRSGSTPRGRGRPWTVRRRGGSGTAATPRRRRLDLRRLGQPTSRRVAVRLVAGGHRCILTDRTPCGSPHAGDALRRVSGRMIPTDVPPPCPTAGPPSTSGGSHDNPTINAYDPIPSVGQRCTVSLRTDMPTLGEVGAVAVPVVAGADPARAGRRRPGLDVRGFTGARRTLVLPHPDGVVRVAVGLGSAGTVDSTLVRDVAAEFARAVPHHKTSRVEIPPGDAGISVADFAQAVTEGVVLARWRFRVGADKDERPSTAWSSSRPRPSWRRRRRELDEAGSSPTRTTSAETSPTARRRPSRPRGWPRWRAAGTRRRRSRWSPSTRSSSSRWAAAASSGSTWAARSRPG